MRQLVFGLVLIIAAPLLSPRPAAAHCQVPCGIYDDAMRVRMMEEDAITIAKAVKAMGALAGKSDAQSQNQLVRWVNTKEAHAEKIIRTIADYFLAQKIPPVGAGDQRARAAYLEQLARHHAVIVAAMKVKQSASPEAVEALTRTLKGIAGTWRAGRKQ